MSTLNQSESSVGCRLLWVHVRPTEHIVSETLQLTMVFTSRWQLLNRSAEAVQAMDQGAYMTIAHDGELFTRVLRELR